MLSAANARSQASCTGFTLYKVFCPYVGLIWYDKRFEMARAQESSDFLREMVYGRLNWPTGLTEQAKIQYEQYLKEHIEQIASDFIRQKRGEELEWLLHTYPLEPGQKELFTGLVNLADTVKSPEILSMLMEYQRLHFPSKRRSFEL